MVANSCFNSCLHCADDPPQGEKETLKTAFHPKGKHWEKSLKIRIIQQHTCCAVGNGEHLPAVRPQESWSIYKGREKRSPRGRIVVTSHSLVRDARGERHLLCMMPTVFHPCSLCRLPRLRFTPEGPHRNHTPVRGDFMLDFHPPPCPPHLESTC